MPLVSTLGGWRHGLTLRGVTAYQYMRARMADKNAVAFTKSELYRMLKSGVSVRVVVGSSSIDAFVSEVKASGQDIEAAVIALAERVWVHEEKSAVVHYSAMGFL